MPQHKSAKKRVRTNEKSRQRNVALRSKLRGSLTRQRTLENAEEATKNLPTVISALDRASKSGLIPARRADRLKSRLARRANKQSA